jgi:uncharacterized membrane protein
VTLAEDDRMHWVAVIEDDTFEWDADLVEHTPDEKVSWRAIDGRETGEVRFEKLAADSTRVTYQLEYDPAAWEGKADTVRHWMRRRVESDLDAFRQIVEAVAWGAHRRPWPLRDSRTASTGAAPVSAV